MKPAPLTQKHKKALSATTKRMYEYLLQGNSLTALDGVQLFGCLCTTQRLGDIKQHQNSENRPWDTSQNTNPANDQ